MIERSCGPRVDEGPRWEYRAFASPAELEPVERAILQRGEREGSFEILDTYLVARCGVTVNVKVRERHLKIKRRLAVDRAVERWATTAYEPFPLSQEFLRRHHLDDSQAGFGDACLDAPFSTPEDLVCALSRPFLDVLVVGVFKRRSPYRLGGCATEIVDLLVAGQVMRSIAVEAERAATVIDTVEAIGLTSHPNRSYPEAVRQTVAAVAARS